MKILIQDSIIDKCKWKKICFHTVESQKIYFTCILSQDAAKCVFHQNKKINQEKIWDEKKSQKTKKQASNTGQRLWELQG